VVANKNTSLRSAFTLIELIFAIVIISIAVISLPMMARITSKGVESNIAQEAIFAASAELMGATSYYWDKNSMQDINVSSLSRVIDINQKCDNNPLSSRYRLRPGHIAQPLHRRCLDSNTTPIANESDATFPNINNAAHSGGLDIFDNPIAEDSGYKETYKSDVSVANVDENGTTNDNIKKITVTVSNAEGNITSLSTYSANIGEFDYFKRMF